MRKVMFFLGLLEDSDIEWIAAHGVKQFAPSGTVLITQGDPIESVFILLEGALSVNTDGGRGKPLALLKSGEIVGEISFVDSRPPLASVQAVANSHVLAISRDILRKKLERDVGFAARFYRALAAYLADRLRVTSGRLGYGDNGQDHDEDELDDAFMDNASMGATRFYDLLRRLRITPSQAAVR